MLFVEAKTGQSWEIACWKHEGNKLILVSPMFVDENRNFISRSIHFEDIEINLKDLIHFVYAEGRNYINENDIGFWIDRNSKKKEVKTCDTEN